MLKNILKLEGVTELTKNEQKGLKGGHCGGCNPEEQCCYVWPDDCWRSTCPKPEPELCNCI